MAENSTLTFENAQLIFRNFSGAETPVAPKGTKTFCVVIPDEKTAQQMLQDGWNVKYPNPKEDQEPLPPFLPVAVKFDPRPPRIVMITDTAKTDLDEESVGALDYVEIKNVDLIVNAYHWNVTGKSGVKAYLKTMFISIEEDELEKKYALME